MNNFLITLLGVAFFMPLQATSISPENKKEFQARFRAACATRQREYQRKLQLLQINGIEEPDDLEEELSKVRMKIRQIPGIAEEEATFLPTAIVGSGALFLGANSLAAQTSSRFILESMAAATVLKFGVAIAATTYAIYKVRGLMSNDEGEKKIKKEFKEGLTACTREFNHKLGAYHEAQEKFETEMKKKIEELRAELHGTYKSRKEKLKQGLTDGLEDIKKRLAAEFAAQNKKIDSHNKEIDGYGKRITASLKQIDEKNKEKKDINAELNAKWELEKRELKSQYEAARKDLIDEFEMREKRLSDLIEQEKAELAEEKALRAQQAKEINASRDALHAMQKGSYKGFMAALEEWKKANEEQPKQSFFGRVLGRGAHSRQNSQFDQTTPTSATEGRSSSITEGRPPLGRRLSQGAVRNNQGTLKDHIDWAKLKEEANSQRDNSPGEGKEGH